MNRGEVKPINKYYILEEMKRKKKKQLICVNDIKEHNRKFWVLLTLRESKVALKYNLIDTRIYYD